MKQSFRAQDYDNDHDYEYGAFLPNDVIKSADPAFQHPECKRCDERAWDGPQPTDDHQRETLENYRLTHAGLHQLTSRKRATWESTKRGGERHGIARPGTGFETNHQRGVAVLRDGTHGATDLCPSQERIKTGECGKCHPRGDDARPCHSDRADLNAIETPGRVHHARGRRKYVLCAIKQNHREAERDENAALKFAL